MKIEKITKLFFHQFKWLATRRSFAPLYHYTTGQSLIQIIESGQMWLTQISCLNDAKEMIYAVELLREAIEIRKRTTINSEFAILLETMSDIVSDPNPETVGVFVVCFSEKNDDLSQWRAYGGDTGGYAIEFDCRKLVEFSPKLDAYLVPVAYDEKTVERLLSEVMKWTEVFFMEGLKNRRASSCDEWASVFARYWLEQLVYLAPVLKHPSFKDEAEWRLIRFLAETDVPNMRFIQRRAMMTRHVPLSLDQPGNDDEYTPLPITGVKVGPASHPRLSQIAVGDLLKSKNYSDAVKVTISEIPFRTAR